MIATGARAKALNQQPSSCLKLILLTRLAIHWRQASLCCRVLLVQIRTCDLGDTICRCLSENLNTARVSLSCRRT